MYPVVALLIYSAVFYPLSESSKFTNSQTYICGVKPSLPRTYCLIFAMLVNGFTYAQSIVENGAVGLFGDTGTAVYEVTNSAFGNSKVKNGSYRFESHQEITQTNPILISEQIKGAFKSGKKHGIWDINFEKTSFVNEGFKNGQPQFYKTQNRIIAKGTFDKGNPSGEWVIQAYQNSRDTLFLLTCQFKNGWVDGMVKYVSPSEKTMVVGNTKQGLMNGNWYFNYPNGTKEIRTYDKGILLFLLQTSGSDTLKEFVFPISQACQKALINKTDQDNPLVNFPMSYTFSDGYPKSSKWITSQVKGEVRIRQIDSIMGVFMPKWKKNVRIAIGTNRCRYPLSSLEAKEINDWFILDKNLKEATASLKDSIASFKHLRISPEINLALNFSLRQEEIIRKTRSWRSIMERGELVYYYRDGQLFEYAKNTLGKDECGDTLFIYKDTKSTDFLGFLCDNWADRIQHAKALQNSLSQVKSRLNLSREIINLTVEIDKRKVQIADWLKRINRDSTFFFKGFTHKLDSTALGADYQKRLERFLNETDINKERQLGHRLSRDLDTLYTFLEYLVEANKQLHVIDSFYTEVRIDAFTFERYPVRIKKRFHLMFSELMNHLNNEAITMRFRSRWNSLQTIAEVQQNMYYLKDANTTFLEKRWAKSKDWELRINLFRIKR